VEKIVDQEASEVSSKEGGFHLKDKDASWDFILNFSMSKALSVFELKGPTILRLLIASAMLEHEHPKPQLVTLRWHPIHPLIHLIHPIHHHLIPMRLISQNHHLLIGAKTAEIRLL
jgi:hypothetical protein